ncbi:unnamed protein product [Durusdinium trenchii]|uniref:Uncharacterized protein n=1 Tax=Durusdinium trenchii TaxID=1381693 RepID=A0ABP0P6X8_9DINO
MAAGVRVMSHLSGLQAVRTSKYQSHGGQGGVWSHPAMDVTGPPLTFMGSTRLYGNAFPVSGSRKSRCPFHLHSCRTAAAAFRRGVRSPGDPKRATRSSGRTNEAVAEKCRVNGW